MVRGKGSGDERTLLRSPLHWQGRWAHFGNVTEHAEYDRQSGRNRDRTPRLG